MAKPYMSPADRLKVSGGGAAGMGSMSSEPGQMEGEDEYKADGPPAPPMKEEGMGETAMIPLALLGGKEFKPGEEVVMKVVKIDKENGTVEIAYATGEDHAPEGGMEEEHPAVAAMPME